MAELQVAPYMWILVLFFLSLLQPTEAVRNALDGPTLEGQPVQPTVQPTQPPNQTEEWRPSTVTEVGKCSIKLGDHFDAASSILLPLDLAWLSGSALIALALILWTPDGLSTRAVGAHGEAPMEEGADEGEGGEDSRSPDSKDAPESTSGAETVQRPKLEAIGWHRVAFDSITSHAAGIVGFIGFQKIVVARIVALSDACDLWSIENILLYTTLALSVVAVFASFVFLGVDYARRLAIYAAQRKGYQLTMKPKDLKETGLGIAIILLGLLMLFLYGCVIVEEAETSDAEQQEMVIDKRWVVVDIAAGGIALALFYFNLRGLHRSPKMQFDAACHGEHKLTLEEFLEGESGQGMATNVSDYASLADFLHWLAGEDLVLLAFKGTRHAIFPQQRRGPLVHVVCGVLAIGAFPLLVQLGAERFFGYPDLVELKSTTGTIAEIELDGVMERPSWSLQTLQTLVNPKARRKKFVFLGDEMAARLQVRTTYQKTSTVQLCCRNGEIGQIPCSSGKLNHRLIKFFTQPVDLDVPPNVSSDCQLILQGFSSRAVTHIPVELTPKREHHLCDCTLEGCKCCGGYKGSLRFNSSRSLEIPAKGYKSLSSLCTPARCDVAKSTGEAGPNCKCQDKYVGQILWNGSIAMGKCEPAPCKGDLLNGLPGPDCSCKDGYTGKTRMVEDFISVFPGCLEAECKVPNSTGKGPKCKCQNGFEGDIRWKGAEAHGSCKPAWCNVSNSNQKRGHQCACLELYQGKIHWDGAIAKGTCEPMTCVGENVNGLRGPDCTCLNGYRGSVLPIQLPMDGSGVAGFLKGTCKAVPCNIINSNKVLGPGCQCKAGFKGNITWKGPVPYGSCEASLCDIANSNGKPGPACKCKFGFGGKVQWRGPQAFGTCWPLHCAGQHVNGVAGPGCSCADGFAPAGKFAYAYTNLASPGIANDIQAIVFRYSGRINSMVGNCSEAPCTIENSNRAPGPSCRCMDGYSGRISWKGSIAQGRCKPALCNIANSNWNGGLDCHCLDGYRGHISWNEHQPSGSCTAVPCRIPHSDFAPGPECQCLPGFHGQIKWIGTQATGECLPIPRCSPNIVYATWLQDELKDPHGYDCDPGQQLVFHGHACDQGKVQWTSVRSLLPGRCRWALSLECGQDPDSKVSQLFSAVSPQLPGECSVEAAAPRCDPQLDYTVTSRRASGYSCGAGSGKVSETQQVQFQGHLCGYDLIQWEAAVLLQEPASDPSLALSCRIKSLSHNSFSCGEIPEGEDLPRGCLQMHQAASFRIWEWQEKTAPFEPTARQWKSVYSMKLFENGMAAVRHLGKDQVGKSYWSTGWFTDGKYLDVRMPNMMDNGAPRPGFFFRVLDDDSQGYKFLSSNKLFRLKASNTLPSWWVSAFQDRTASGKIDSLWQCELSHYENGTCYQAKVGVAVQIFQSSEEMCSSWIVNLNKSADFDYFTYLHSAHEVQTYASKAECLPIAARHELQLEIAEIHSAGPGAFVVASMETRCRQTLRFVASAADLTKCKNKADAQWKARQRPFSNQHTGTDDDDEDEDHDEDYDYDEDENYDDFDSMDEMDDSMDDTSHAMEEVD